MRLFPYAGLVLALVIQTQIAVAQQKAVGTDDERSRRLAYMKQAAASYQIFLGNDEGTQLRLIQTPVLRFGDQITKVPDGALFLWTGKLRPQAMVCIWYHPNGSRIHEFQSLAHSKLLAKRNDRIRWHPSKSGVEFRPIPNAAQPANSPAVRLRQMKDFAKRFTASVDDPKYGRQQLRLMPQPLYRYGTDDSDVVDGTLFAFSKGTNPEVVLLIEGLRDEAQRYQWNYASARMSNRECQVQYNQEVVWTIPLSKQQRPDEPYFNFVLR